MTEKLTPFDAAEYLESEEDVAVFLNEVQIYTISCTALHPVVHAAEFFTPAADSSIEFFF